MLRVVLVDCYVDEQGRFASFLPWLAGVIADDAARQPVPQG
jgi:hypothetical protein